MATNGFRGVRFVCHIIMEEEIHANHTVLIKAPGLTIDNNGGEPRDTVTFFFTHANWNIPQNLGITGEAPGRYKLFADITSPFYISHNILKIKKDTVDITIANEESNGWHGSHAGCAQSISGISSDSEYANGDLHYHYNNIVADSGTFSLAKTAGYAGDLSCVFKIVKPDGSHIYSNSCMLDAVGMYNAYPIENFYTNNSGTGSLGASVFTATIRGGSPDTGGCGSSGLIYEGVRTIAPSPYDTPFSENVGNTVDYNGPGSFSCVNPDTTTSVGALGSITYLDGMRFTFAGHITSPGGEAWNAIVTPIPISYIAIGSVPVGTGSVTLQIYP